MINFIFDNLNSILENNENSLFLSSKLINIKNLKINEIKEIFDKSFVIKIIQILNKNKNNEIEYNIIILINNLISYYYKNNNQILLGFKDLFNYWVDNLYNNINNISKNLYFGFFCIILEFFEEEVIIKLFEEKCEIFFNMIKQIFNNKIFFDNFYDFINLLTENIIIFESIFKLNYENMLNLIFKFINENQNWYYSKLIFINLNNNSIEFENNNIILKSILNYCESVLKINLLAILNNFDKNNFETLLLDKLNELEQCYIIFGKLYENVEFYNNILINNIDNIIYYLFDSLKINENFISIIKDNKNIMDKYFLNILSGYNSLNNILYYVIEKKNSISNLLIQILDYIYIEIKKLLMLKNFINYDYEEILDILLTIIIMIIEEYFDNEFQFTNNFTLDDSIVILNFLLKEGIKNKEIFLKIFDINIKIFISMKDYKNNKIIFEKIKKFWIDIKNYLMMDLDFIYLIAIINCLINIFNEEIFLYFYNGFNFKDILIIVQNKFSQVFEEKINDYDKNQIEYIKNVLENWNIFLNFQK